MADAIKIDTQCHSWIVVQKNCEALVRSANAELVREGIPERRADHLRGVIEASIETLKLGDTETDIESIESTVRLYQ